MSYKIAIASTDGIYVDRSFRNAEEFLIVEVDDGGSYKVSEIRKYEDAQPQKDDTSLDFSQNTHCGSKAGCGGGTGCGGAASPKLLLVEDCRCLLCTQIGFKIHKQLEKKAISAFEVDYQIDDALEKIISYFDKVDKHQSLRGIAKGQKK